MRSWQGEHRGDRSGPCLDFLPPPGSLHVQPPAEVAHGAEATRPYFPPPRSEAGPSARWERRRSPRYVNIVECFWVARYDCVTVWGIHGDKRRDYPVGFACMPPGKCRVFSVLFTLMCSALLYVYTKVYVPGICLLLVSFHHERPPMTHPCPAHHTR